MAIIKYMILSIFLMGCISTRSNRADKIQKSSFSPVIITQIAVVCIDTTYIITGYTGSMPPREIKKIDGFIYEISFSITVAESDSVFTEPFYIIVDFSPDRSEVILFNQDHEKITAAQFYDYNFAIHTNMKDKIRVTLGYKDLNDNVVMDRENPFQSKILVLK